MPAFHGSVRTVTGKPHGYHLYSWNSGYRREVRERLYLTGAHRLKNKWIRNLGLVIEADTG